MNPRPERAQVSNSGWSGIGALLFFDKVRSYRKASIQSCQKKSLATRGSPWGNPLVKILGCAVSTWSVELGGARSL
jgi:hypothetical protein